MSVLAGDGSDKAYAGDVDVHQAWALLESDPKAQLIDVRSQAEWAFVGVPNLEAVSRKVLCVELQRFPDMARNEAFVDQLQKVLRGGGAEAGTPLLFLCRSGARSRTAAMLATQLGFTSAYNIAGGFEGDLDQSRHRSSVNGWRAADLPWVQN